MAKPNYKQIFAKKKAIAEKLKKVCPNITNVSGIYFYTREKPLEEDGGGSAFYIGKSRTLLDRCVSHDMGYSQRIDISLKKRKYYSEANPYGWKLNVLFFPEHLLDEKERYYIELYKSKENGECYNVESGGTLGKEIIGERKKPKTYTDGKKFGRKQLANELKHIIDNHLIITLKKETKISKKALEKFYNLLDNNE